MDELNLYDDLDEFQEQQEKKSKELQDVENKYANALDTIHNLEEDKKALQKKIQRIELSFQSLLDTARSEIKRKDKEIERLRKEKDDICFRRRVPNPHQEIADSAASFQQVKSNTLVLPENHDLQSKSVERNISNVFNADRGSRNRERSSDHYGESHKRHRSRDDRDSYNYKRHRNDREHYKSTETHRNKRDHHHHQQFEREERDISHKNERSQKTDYSIEERHRNRYESERCKTRCGSSESIARDVHRNSRSEQYYNRKYSPSRRGEHVDKYYTNSTKTSDRNERSREEIRGDDRNTTYSKSWDRKVSYTLNKVSPGQTLNEKEQHSSHAAKEIHKIRSHSNVSKGVGHLQHEQDISKKNNNSKPTSSQKILNASDKLDNLSSLKSITSTHEVAVKENLSLKNNDNGNVKNTTTRQELSKETVIEGPNEKSSNKNAFRESQESQNQHIMKNKQVSIEDYLYGDFDETDAQPESLKMTDILYGSLDCDAPKKDLPQTGEGENLEETSYQLGTKAKNGDFTNVACEIVDDDLPEGSIYSTKNTDKLENNDVKIRSLNITKGFNTCKKPPSNDDDECQIVGNNLGENTDLDCQKSSTNNEVIKSVLDALNCKIPITHTNTSLDSQKLCTPRKVILFNSLFGPSPSSAGSADSNKNLLSSISSKSIGADSIISTSPGDYSDCVVSSNKEDGRSQIDFDMVAFEKCFEPTIKDMDKNTSMIAVEDSSDDCVIVAENDNNDVGNSCPQKNNIGLTNVSSDKSLHNSDGTDSLKVMTHPEEIVAPQQTSNQIKLVKCSAKDANSLFANNESCKHSLKTDGGVVPPNNNIDPIKCCTTSDNSGRERVLLNGDSIDLTEETFGEEVEFPEVPSLDKAVNVIISNANKNSDDDDQVTPNNNFESSANQNRSTEMVAVYAGAQQIKVIEEPKEHNNNGGILDQMSSADIEKQSNQDGTLITVANDNFDEENNIILKSNATQLPNHTTQIIKLNLLTKTTVSNREDEEKICGAGIVNTRTMEPPPTNTEIKKDANKIAADKPIVAVQTAPDILNDNCSASRDHVSAPSINFPVILFDKEKIFVETEDISKRSVVITDVHEWSSNNINEIGALNEDPNDSDILPDVVLKDGPKLCSTNLQTLGHTKSTANSTAPAEEKYFSAMEHLSPVKTVLADEKVEIQSFSSDTTNSNPILVRKDKLNTVLSSIETNNNSDAKCDTSEDSVANSSVKTVDGNSDISVDPGGQISKTCIEGSDHCKIQAIGIELNNFCSSKLPDVKSPHEVGVSSLCTNIVKTQLLGTVNDVDIYAAESSQQLQSSISTPIETITLDNSSPDKDAVNDSNCMETKDEDFSLTRIVSNSSKEFVMKNVLDTSALDSEKSSKEQGLNQTEIALNTKKIDYNITTLKSDNFEPVSIPNDETNNMVFTTFPELELKTLFPNAKSTIENNDYAQCSETGKDEKGEKSNVIDLKNYTLENRAILEDSYNTERYTKKERCETTVNTHVIISTENVENPLTPQSTSMTTVIVTPPQLATVEPILESSKQNVETTSEHSLLQSKQITENDDLGMKIDHTSPDNTHSKRMIQKDYFNLTETAENIPGLNLLLSSESLQNNSDVSEKSFPNSDIVQPKCSLSGPSTNEFTTSNKVQKSMDDTNICFSQNSLLSPTGVCSTRTMENDEKEDARPTSSEANIDISATDINNTINTVSPKSKEFHKTSIKDTSGEPKTLDSEPSEQNILVKIPRASEDINVVHHCDENIAKELNTNQPQHLADENLALTSPLQMSKEGTKNIKNLMNVLNNSTPSTKQDIQLKLKKTVNIETKKDLDIQNSCDNTKVDVTLADDSVINLKGINKNNICLPEGSSLDENQAATTVVDHCKVIEEINNNPATDEFKKDTSNIFPLQNNCKDIDIVDRTNIKPSDLDARQHDVNSQKNMKNENVPTEDNFESIIKSPSHFNKPAESILYKSYTNLETIEHPRKLNHQENVYSSQVVQKITATATEITQTSSSNFDAIINFEQNLSLVDQSVKNFTKDINPTISLSEKVNETINKGDFPQSSFQVKCASKMEDINIAGQSPEQHKSLKKLKANSKHDSITFEKETRNNKAANNLLENQYSPVLSHKISQIFFTTSKFDIENTNSISNPSDEQQEIMPMICESHIDTSKQNVEEVNTTPPLVQTIVSKEIQDKQNIISSPSSNLVVPSLNFYQERNPDSTINNVDIAEINNVTSSPSCTTLKQGSLNTLKTSTLSDSYGSSNNLPSIPIKCPTPPNFSGLFSKTSFMDSTREETEKFKEKSSKPKAYIIPAASVLCNVNNLQNATKASKKLHWEMLENKNELTEIEDDSEINSTDEEQLHKKECNDDRQPPKEVTKVPIKDLVPLASDLKSLKNLKCTAVEHEGNKLSQTITSFSPKLPKDLKSKKSSKTRRKTVDTLQPLNDETVEQFKHLAIASSSSYKLLKSRDETSGMYITLGANVVKSSAGESADTVTNECISGKSKEVIAPYERMEKMEDNERKDVTQAEFLEQAENYTIIKALDKGSHNEEDVTPKLYAPKSTIANKNATNLNDSLVCEDSPVKIDVHNTVSIYEKLHSSDEHNSSVAENSEPECNKYLKEEELHPIGEEPADLAHSPEIKIRDNNDTNPTLKLAFKPADKSALTNYKIPKFTKQGGIKSRDINKVTSVKADMSSFRMPKGVNNTKEFTKKSNVRGKTNIAREDGEKTTMKIVGVEKSRSENRKTTEDTLEPKKAKSKERCQRRQNMTESKAHDNSSFVEFSTKASKKIVHTDERIANRVNNDIFKFSDQAKTKGDIKPRRKSMCASRTTERNANLSDEDNVRSKLRPLRKSLYIEESGDEDVLGMEKNVKLAYCEQNKHSTDLNKRRKQNRLLDSSSEDDDNHTSKSKDGHNSTRNLKSSKNVIAKNKTFESESIKSITISKRLPKTSAVKTSLDIDIYNNDGTEDNKNDLRCKFEQVRKLYLQLQKQLMGNNCEENDTKNEDLPLLDDEQYNENKKQIKKSNVQSTNTKRDPPKNRRKTIDTLHREKLSNNEKKMEVIDKNSSNETNGSRKTMIAETKLSKTSKKHSPNNNENQIQKAVKNTSKDLAVSGKQTPTKPIVKRRKSMYAEIQLFDSNTGHFSNQQCQINSDPNIIDLGRYQDGNSRKSVRNRRKSMYVEQVPLFFSDDTDTAPETISDNNTAKNNRNPVKEDKYLQRIETNSDNRKKENNFNTVYTEEISKTYDVKEISQAHHPNIQNTTKPILSFRMLKKPKPSGKVIPTLVGQEFEKPMKIVQNANEKTSNLIPHVGAEKDFKENKSDDNHSDSDTSAIVRNIKDKEMGLKSFNLQRRILDSLRSDDDDDDEDDEEEENIQIPAKTVIHNKNNETTPTLAVKEERLPRKRRISKVVSTSLTDSQVAKKIKCSPNQFEDTTPPALATLNHPIFLNSVEESTESHLNMTPLSNEDCYHEIDSTLRDMFHSPQHETEHNNLQQAAQGSMVSVLDTEYQLNDSETKTTFAETAFTHGENSLNISNSNDSKSLNSSASQDLSATKHLSLGTSQYRFEKVSNNVVNLFISRKRRRNKTNNNNNNNNNSNNE